MAESVKKEVLKRFDDAGWTIKEINDYGFGIQHGKINGFVVIVDVLSGGKAHWHNLYNAVNQAIADKSFDFAIITNKYLFEIYKKGQCIGDLSLPPTPETAIHF